MGLTILSPKSSSGHTKQCERWRDKLEKSQDKKGGGVAR